MSGKMSRRAMQHICLTMREQWTRVRERICEKEHLLLVFFIGLLLGIFLLNGTDISSKIGCLDKETLTSMKEASIDRKAYLNYLFRNRMWLVACSSVLATTYLGSVTAYMTTIGFGTMVAVFFREAIHQYGLRGVLLGFVSMFPQYILYFPAFFLLNRWCIRLCRLIHTPKCKLSCNGKEGLKALHLGQLAFVVFLVSVGCLAETYINVSFLQEFLTFF